jgi:fructose-bisphosphate aldolase class 1
VRQQAGTYCTGGGEIGLDTAAIPGIMFLSGGRSEEEATLNLNTINKLVRGFVRGPAIGRELDVSRWGRALGSTSSLKRDILLWV